jgi:hypothetical protein
MKVIPETPLQTKLDIYIFIFTDFGTSFNRCDNGISVPSYKWCDNVDDCFDNSDEVNCSKFFLFVRSESNSYIKICRSLFLKKWNQNWGEKGGGVVVVIIW